MPLLKQIAARLPSRWQSEMKRFYFHRLIKKNAFISHEPEFEILNTLVSPNDWVIDIGANIGHYTKRFSELVGPHGRVIAFEPVAATFSLLAANTQLFAHNNVTLLNAAVSDKQQIAGMTIPKFQTGLTNYYEAQLSNEVNCELSVFTIPLDALHITQRISTIKIDAEGHEAFVLAGMRQLIIDHQPIMIIETHSESVISSLVALKYNIERLQNSPNILATPQSSP